MNIPTVFDSNAITQWIQTGSNKTYIHVLRTMTTTDVDDEHQVMPNLTWPCESGEIKGIVLLEIRL